MDKSYKCDFCKFDRPVESPNEKCSECKLGSCFEVKKRLSPRQEGEWVMHMKLDKFLTCINYKFNDAERALIHRSMVSEPLYTSFPPRRCALSNEVMRLRSIFREMLISVPLDSEEKEKKDG